MIQRLASGRSPAHPPAMIHLDANGSTGLLPDVLDAMLRWLRDSHANPSGAYAGARRAREAIGESRARVADWIGAAADELVFTSGGTESVHTALHSLDRLVGPGHVVVSTIEHSAVLRAAEALARPVKYAPVGRDGRLDLDRYAALLPGAAMVSLMAANNETGVIQPLAEAAAMARTRGIPVHTDAVQMAGKLAIDVRALGVDLLSLSAHKFHGPKGMGALFIRRGIRFFPLLAGGSQENERRAGTENLPGIVGMAAAAARHARNPAADATALQVMRDAFESKLLRELPGTEVNGCIVHRLPNTSHLSFEGCEAVELLTRLDRAGLECSAGSACMAGKIRPSHVQLAMSIGERRGRSSIRFSFSLLNTPADAHLAAEIVSAAVREQRAARPVPCPYCVAETEWR